MFPEDHKITPVSFTGGSYSLPTEYFRNVAAFKAWFRTVRNITEVVEIKEDVRPMLV